MQRPPAAPPVSQSIPSLTTILRGPPSGPPPPPTEEASTGPKASISIHRGTLECDKGQFSVLQFGPSDPTDSSPVVFYLHGAGMSANGFTLCASALYLQSSADGGRKVRGIALDLRCHGESTSEGGEESLTMEQLVSDTISVVKVCISKWYPAVRAIYFVGHSLGGAIVANVMQQHKTMGFEVAAAVVLDVVEGTAKQSLLHMKSFLDRRPETFSSTADGIKWFLSHGGIHNAASAEISVPHLLRPEGTRYRWRTDLKKTLPLWENWFADLDKKFLSIPCPKMLCLAGTDRLDKEVTIGHMMGKFQLEVVGGNCGHYVMEDAPEAVAGKLLRLVRRIDTLYAKLPILNHNTSAAQ